MRDRRTAALPGWSWGAVAGGCFVGAWLWIAIFLAGAWALDQWPFDPPMKPPDGVEAPPDDH